MSFFVILLEDLLRAEGLFTKMFSDFLKSGTYVPTKCQIILKLYFYLIGNILPFTF